MIGRHWWLVLVVLGDLAVAEWVRSPGWGPAAVAIGAWLLAAAGVVRRGGIGLVLALALAIGALVFGASERRFARIGREWAAVREETITSAADRWLRELKYARALVERVAAGAAATAGLDRESVFDRLGRLITREPLELGVVVLEADGTPFAWAGRHRVAPEPEGDSIDFNPHSSYYAVLEARRHLAGGRTAVASLLLAADSTVPDQARSLARRFAARAGVGVEVIDKNLAPNTSDVFDYLEPTPGGGVRLLFSVQLRPPGQAEAIATAFRSTVLRMVAAALVTLPLALVLAAPGLPRFLLAAVPAVVASRAPLGDAIDLPIASSRTFFHELLGPISASAAPLMATAGLVAMVALVGLGRGSRSRWWGPPVAVTLLLGAPFLVSLLGRGIEVPLDGVSPGLWVTWQLVVFLVAAAIILVAAALLPRRPGGGLAPAALGVAIGVGAAVVGLVVWNARSGWPDWYPFLWAAALGAVIWPGRRGVTVAGVGIAAGSAAALIVWGAEVEGRVRAGRADMATLGARADPLAVPLLDAFLSRVDRGAAPRSPSDLFALWRSSPLSRQAFPATLGLWSDAGDPGPQLVLDELDLPDSLVRRLVRSLPPGVDRSVEPLQRIPAVHYLALIRIEPGSVLAVGLGPRTTLVPQARLGRLLDPGPGSQPLYRLTLSPTGSLLEPREGVTLWRREGWVARGSRTVAMGDGARDVHGQVDLGRPEGLLVRGALVVVIDLLVLAALTALGGWLAWGRVERPAWWPEWRAFRTRIALALGAFFLAPAAGFALINILELANDGRIRRDLMIAQTLRDAAPGSVLPPAPAGYDRYLEELSQRVDANLVLYRDGLLYASNGAGLFEDFGAVDPLIDPEVFHRLQLEGEPSAAADGPAPAPPTRIGVRSVRLPTGDPAMLASPQVSSDPDITRQQYDLAYTLALAVVLGLVAASIGARWSARALTRPASDLRDAALAFGRGEPLPAPSGEPPAEFAPVFAALEKMAADVRATQEAQERAARVLAWGEMANQIAHEIKNPLTPMRLGIQHLQRVHRDGRPLGPTLEETSRRILGEIDRLDTIARAFSRFAAPAEGRPAPEPTPLGEVAREVVALYGLAPDAGGVSLRLIRDGSVLAHRDEVKETLVNLLENSRNADARSIVVAVDGPELRVIDDGCGISPEEMTRIFEPRFSTTTSGSGLGLAIVKRLVEGWDATIEVESEVGKGTTVRIRFRETERRSAPT